MKIEVTLNGATVVDEVEPTLLAVDWIRENRRLTGTHVGCDTSQCGACTILLDGASVKSCTLLALSLDGRSVTTIEGLTVGRNDLHPMQAAFHEHHGLQCGFCTPGMIMRAVDIASQGGPLDETTVRHALEGNICRCTGYQNIVASVIAGAKTMNAATVGE
ncbi:(2Fe-2S)-binding protein [Methyloraptor flagellatus]|jgi:carbon-monoxide dehydrogenase small subunit|uniref:(2Fe-2S)-binding protein n=1 Tax=Methyloraptor flagellatus TaxID=3162530 RepID=A0AAU7X7I4_9HYPH